MVMYCGRSRWKKWSLKATLAAICPLMSLIAATAQAASPQPASPPLINAATPTRPAIIQGSEERDFRSKINNVSYRITVVLPPDYDSKKEPYPVFYLLDGNWFAPLAQASFHRLTSLLIPDIPDVIIVGIDYPGKTGRSMDYGTTTDWAWKIPPERGIVNFMRVIKEEIVPYIDGRYHTDPKDRAIGGHSFGGFAATYALFHANDVFQKFWISSPSLVWNSSEALRYPDAYAAKHVPLNAMVYADAGELESRADMVDLVLGLHERVIASGITGLNWKQKIYGDITHAVVPMAALPEAMLFLYGLPDIKVPVLRLESLVGRYRKPDGTILALSTDGNNLIADGMSDKSPYFSQAEHLRLKAASPNHFYVSFVASHLKFPEGESRPSSVEISNPDKPSAYRKNRMKSVIAQRIDEGPNPSAQR